MMKKKLSGKLAVLLAAAGVLAAAAMGCGQTQEAAEAVLEAVKVGATPAPHAEILEIVKDDLEAKGYSLEIVEYNDYVLPNTAVSDGELDANFFQHQPYLDNFNEENGTELVSVAAVHSEPFGLYGGKTTALADLQEGAQVAVPNDTTNEARALLLLEAQGLITLNEGAGINATKLDIVENPLNLDIVEMEAAQLARALQDVDVAAINGNYAVDAGLSLGDALAVEAADSLGAQTYANVLVVSQGNEDTDKTKALVEVLLSEEVKTFMEENYDGAVIPVF